MDIKFYRASGNGGQNRNKVETAVKIIHKPSKISIQCTQEREQWKNKKIALEVLNVKINDYYNNINLNNQNHQRQEQIGSGSRDITRLIRTVKITDQIVIDMYGNKKTLKEYLSGNL